MSTEATDREMPEAADVGLEPDGGLFTPPDNATPARPGPQDEQPGLPDEAVEAAQASLAQSLVTLGFVAFDGQGTDNTSSGLLVSAELRRHFRRDTYVGIDDVEQGITFLGRVVEGPFHSPHELGADSVISRTTLLHPERTQFRPTYYAAGTIEVLGEVGPDEVVQPTSTRPRPYSRTFIYPADRLRKMLGLEGSLVYQRTIVGTAPGQTATSTPRDLTWSLYIDSVMPDGVTDPGWTIIPSVALTVVENGSGTIAESYQLPLAWTLTEMEAAVVEEWDSSDSAPIGGGAQPDDVYAGLVSFTITSQPGPGWTCLPTCVPNTSQPLAMRWDDASYIATPSGGAAVFPYIVPVQYSTTGKEAAVANHIQLACTNPGATQPVNPNKSVPGCDYQHPLHRLLEDSVTGSRYRANRRAAISVCRSVWGRNYARGANGQALECDEYPFASTYEGSAQSKYDSSAAPNNFSALPVDGSENGSAGSQLKNFYLWNRILNTPTDDGFYVSINGLASAPAPLPPVDPVTVGRINGSVVQAHQIDTMSDAQLSAEMTNLAGQHMYTVILDSVADSHDLQADGAATAVYPTAQPGYTRSTTTDVVSRLLNAARGAGIRVLVGLPTDDQWHTQYANDAGWMQSAASTDIAFANELDSVYGANPSFDGWYLPLTVDNIHFSAAAAQANLVNYYNTVTDGLRALTGDATIAIAPSFDAVDTTVPGWQSSSAYAAMWGGIAGQTDIDVIDLQDGVGDGHAATSDLGTWFTAMNNAIQGAGSASDLYADTQTYKAGPSGNTPMGVKNVVADLGAVNGIADAVWSSSYTGYLSPNSPFGAASSSSYGTAYSTWAKTGTGDGSDGGVPPTTPTGVTVTPVDSQSITVAWNASTDPALPIAGYTVIRNGNPVATLIGSATTFTDSGLFGSSNYTYKIQAFDGAGNTSASGGNITATTPATPSAPTDYARCGAASGHAGCPYTSSIPADPAYPDTGGVSATDGVYGTAAFGPAWQGREDGTYTFTVDLGTSRTFTQIKSDWLLLHQDSPWDSANLPTSLTYSVSSDGSTWQQAATVAAPPVSMLTKSVTYKALNLNCTARYVRITVTANQPGWSMLDEIEVRGT